MQSKDQLGRTHTFKTRPGRIVSLVPSQTELLVDLSLAHSLVGVTKFCVHPQQIRKSKTVVGGTKQIKFEKIKSLAPDIIIANKEENTLDMVRQLSAIAPVWVSDIYTVQDSFDFIMAIGTLFDKNREADNLITSITKARATFIKEVISRNQRKVAYLIWKKPYMAAGRATFINALLAENKFENFLDDPASRYPEVNLEDLKNVDLVLLSSEPFPFKESDRSELEELLGIPVKLVDGEYFSWYGSRLLKAYDYFKRLP